jgi:hypothetical protein
MSRKAEEAGERRLPVVPPRRVSADDLKITVDGQDYFPRQGQWVEFIRPIPWAYFMAERKREEAGDDPGRMYEAWQGLRETLASLLWDWNWTDIDGNPLPCPHNNVDALNSCSIEETAWLNRKVTPTPDPQS